MKKRILALSIFTLSTVFSSFACNEMPKVSYDSMYKHLSSLEGFQIVSEFRGETIDKCLSFEQIKKLYVMVNEKTPKHINDFLSIAISKTQNEDDRKAVIALFKK